MNIPRRFGPYSATGCFCLAFLAAFLFPLPLRADESASGVPEIPSPAIAGFDTGLYGISGEGRLVKTIWTGGEVRTIAPVPGGAYFLASTGIFRYFAAGDVEDRSGNLPSHSFKSLREGTKILKPGKVDLKALAVDPQDPSCIATTSSTCVFFSRNAGIAWESMGFPVSTPGARALAIAPYPGTAEKALWFSHPIKGVFVRKIQGGAKWTAFERGIPRLSATTVEEVSGFVMDRGSIYAATTFAGLVLRFDAALGSFVPSFDLRSGDGIVESPSSAGDGVIRYLDSHGIRLLFPSRPSSSPPSAAFADTAVEARVREAAAAMPESSLRCMTFTDRGKTVTLSELWMLAPPASRPHKKEASGRNGLYLQTGYILSAKDRAARFDMMKAKGLDTLVVDAKDDSGRLRFRPKNPSLQSASLSAEPFDPEEFAKDAHARGLYLVARIVAFKDENLWRMSNGRLAIRDSGNGSAWQGYRTVAAGAQSPGGRKFIGEYWVDPYSEEVWKYNVDIAGEMILSGFDEIQFDYIRFPTDGENLAQARYSWADPGMDEESALLSFLSYARENLDAPISVDIYGANGWYRSGLKTGQDVELFSRYVDAICPMFYPSHFEQDFLAYPPAKERPYRIYRSGSLRNRHFARGLAVIRPWVQSFFLDVAYDREYYGDEYVRKEVLGIGDSTADGMTFWNNVGRYDEVPSALGRGLLSR
jgi:hypothetical protein